MTTRLIYFFTLMLSGRMMTIAFVHRAGGDGAGDPPVAWLMPLIGDAVVGITGLVVFYLLVRKSGMAVWTAAIVWNSIGIWDALSAYIISETVPWPEFFMLRLIGPAMFFAASALHLALIVLLCREDARSRIFGTGPR